METSVSIPLKRTKILRRNKRKILNIMDIQGTKILVACLFGIVRIVFGFLPIKIYKCLSLKDGESEKGKFVNDKRNKQVHCGLALFQAFGGGVIFATCFLHMIPQVYESTIQLKKFGLVHSKYPFSQLIVSFGFFIVYFIEEFAHYLISRITDDRKASVLDSCSNKVAPDVEDDTATVIEDLQTPTKEVFKFHENNMEVYKESKNNEQNENSDLNNMKSREVEQIEELEKIMDEKSRSQQQVLRGFLIIVALSLHAFFEGLAIGFQTSIGDIWYLFVAISIHSATILFCIGLELLLAQAKKSIIIMLILILSLTSPAGVFLGLLITLNTDTETKVKSIAIVFLEGLSAGTILYITFFEVLNREKDRRVYRLRRAACILLGFGLMACLECGEMYY